MDAALPTLQKNIRNSELNIAKEKRTFLTYPANGLAPCTLEETEDSVHFLFNTKGTEPATAILDMPKWEQFRFLANCADLDCLSQEYDFALSLDNMRIDMNLIPQLLMRDAKSANRIDFLQRYKALIGSVLQRKYQYDHYIHGGQDLYKKNKLLTELANLETVEALQRKLLEEYRRLLRETHDTKKLVPKKTVIISQILFPLLILFILSAAFFGGRMLLIDIPLRDSVIAASNAYIHGDLLSVQRELQSYDIDRLPDETKYILSRAYVSTEALTHTQINNILLGLAKMTEPIIFDYWIYLGRLYFDEAIDIAQRLGDDELLLFAYLKYEVYVRNDSSIPGEERLELLSTLENHINRLNRARDEAAGNPLINP